MIGVEQKSGLAPGKVFLVVSLREVPDRGVKHTHEGVTGVRAPRGPDLSTNHRREENHHAFHQADSDVPRQGMC